MGSYFMGKGGKNLTTRFCLMEEKDILLSLDMTTSVGKYGKIS
jgi:hypothetical protein